MLEAFLTFINQQKFDLHKKSTLLTVSGGVDSVVLAHLFHKAGFQAGIAHCNFSLRNKESDGDEAFVRELAEGYKFPFYVKKFDTKNYAEEQGISTQMAARELRYKWFEEVRIDNGYDGIATAHHANDSFETVILNLVRGTGLAGLHGITSQNKALIRPLLFTSREYIQEYIRINNLIWREDSSNESNNYKRNLIRHEVIPILKQMNPSLETTFKTTSQRIRAAENLLTDFLENWKKEAVKYDDDEEYKILISALISASEPVYKLWFVLQEFGFSYAQADEIYKSVESISGKVFQSSTHVVLKDRDYFVVTKITKEAGTLELKINYPPGEYQFGDSSFSLKVASGAMDFSFGQSPSTAYFDIDKLEFPLTMRHWEIGDSFCPFGMSGKRKKISDLLIDLKLNLNQKRKVKILLNGNREILWVIGIRTDERYRINDESKEILMITEKN